jgi:hypothetical protein
MTLYDLNDVGAIQYVVDLVPGDLEQSSTHRTGKARIF